MHILVIPSWYPTAYDSISGVFFKEQAESLAKHGINITVVSVNMISVKEIVKQKRLSIGFYTTYKSNLRHYAVNIIKIPKLKQLNKLIQNVIGKYLLKKVISNSPPDLIHLHSFFLGEFSLWIKNKYNINYVVTEHSSAFIRGILNEKEMRLAEKVYCNSETNLVVSNKLGELLSKKFGRKFRYVPNIVDTKFFKPQCNYNKEFTFLNIAFLNTNKNQLMLIEAFSMLLNGGIKAKLIIAGDGLEMRSLKSRIRQLSLEENIVMYGKAEREEVKALFRKAHVFVLSSLYETFGVVLIEAMSCGLPVISTRSGGPESIITNRDYGVLCDTTIQGLFEAMKATKEKHENYDSEKIRQYAKSNFSKEVVIKKLDKIYLNAIS